MTNYIYNIEYIHKHNKIEIPENSIIVSIEEKDSTPLDVLTIKYLEPIIVSTKQSEEVK